MPIDIDNIYATVAAVDADELQAEVDDLRAEQDRINRELGKRLDLLELMQRWRNATAHGAPLGTQRAVAERQRHQPVPTATAPSQESPRGTVAARRVMQEGGVWNAKQLHGELEERGWVNPEAKHPLKATETALTRLLTKYQEVERVGRGLYRYKGTPSDPNLLDPNGSAEL